MYNRLNTDGDQVPDKVTEISSQEAANIYGSINAILDAVLNDGTVGTLAGLDSTTTIEPMPSEYDSSASVGDVSAFIAIEPPGASLAITRDGTDALEEADITEGPDIIFYDENEVHSDII